MAVGLVVFDFDGTLVDTFGDIAASLNAARVELGGSAAPLVAVRSWIGEGLDHLIREALPAGVRHAEMKRRYRAQYERRMYETSRPYDGVLGMLNRLAALPLAVASNKSEHFVLHMLAHFGLTPRFIAAIGGDSLSIRKPDPGVIAHLVAVTSARGDVWMVGDSAVDVETGRAFGARTIGCAYGIRGREELARAKADHIVATAPEIADIILG